MQIIIGNLPGSSCHPIKCLTFATEAYNANFSEVISHRYRCVTDTFGTFPSHSRNFSQNIFVSTRTPPTSFLHISSYENFRTETLSLSEFQDVLPKCARSLFTENAEEMGK